MHLNVPFGHGVGTDVPTGQKKPGGHGNPVRVSDGEGSEAPPTQTIPAEHGPLGEALPLQENHSGTYFITQITKQ